MNRDRFTEISIAHWMMTVVFLKALKKCLLKMKLFHAVSMKYAIYFSIETTALNPFWGFH